MILLASESRLKYPAVINDCCLRLPRVKDRLEWLDDWDWGFGCIGLRQFDGHLTFLAEADVAANPNHSTVVITPTVNRRLPHDADLCTQRQLSELDLVRSVRRESS
jgi:hypothetical protein